MAQRCFAPLFVMFYLRDHMENYFDPLTNRLRLTANLGVRLVRTSQGFNVTPNTLPGTTDPFAKPFLLPKLDSTLIETCSAWLRRIWWKTGNASLWVFYLSLERLPQEKWWHPYFPPQVIAPESVRATLEPLLELNLPITHARLAGSLTVVTPNNEADVKELIYPQEGIHLLLHPLKWMTIEARIRTADAIIPVSRLQEVIQDDRFEDTELNERIQTES
jgi:hypothetical protein